MADVLDELMKLPDAMRVERACLAAQPDESPLAAMGATGEGLGTRSDGGPGTGSGQASLDEALRARMEGLLEGYERRIRAGLRAFELMRLDNPGAHAGPVCQLHYLEGMTWREVGECLGMAGSSVFRARKEGIAWLAAHPNLVEAIEGGRG